LARSVANLKSPFVSKIKQVKELHVLGERKHSLQWDFVEGIMALLTFICIYHSISFACGASRHGEREKMVIVETSEVLNGIVQPTQTHFIW